MTTSVRLLGTAAALGVGVLATSLLTQPTATAASTEKPGTDGESGQGISICRPISFTGPITVECSSAPSGGSANGSADYVAKDHGEDGADEDES
ncbi:hypothetical protein [Saccharopolyspora phatthalungensis]|uniref:Uncharacterized protein n=1 Tax=Saccharopolyspora phatthalungensis TaxID=664693 RepID=A0A840PX94_9PSEU|nr:hypothetical protein [Saccharopolyspora phatthalungensis]MBB5154902.1 hypothetical protein [Saccharopolyspora phatthalungensis]